MEPDSHDPRFIDGTAVANAITDATATRAEAFAQAAGTRPCLADDLASKARRLVGKVYQKVYR